VFFVVFAVLASLAAVVLGILACAWSFCDHMTLRRRVTEQRRQNLELQSMLRRQGILAREVAHELKNPIAAIVCAAEALELILDAELDDDNRRTLHHIREYGDHVLKLMHDFIDISRGVGGQLTSNKEIVPIADIANSVVGLLSPTAGRKGVAIELEGTALAPRVLIDPKHLKRMLFNLVDNAVKFSPPNTVVVVRLVEDSTRQLASIEVADSGPGMSEHEKNALFDPVRSSSKEGSCGEVGTGIGLMLTRTLAQLEGARIEVRTQPGAGTTVVLSMPTTQFLQEALAPGAPEPARPLEGQTVLLIDSDPGVRDVVSRLIEALGGAVDGVSLVVDAVDALHRNTYSAVMIDESVDGLQGCEVAQLLKQDPAGRNVRIVLASSRPVDRSLARDSGADRCIEKPLDRRALIESLLQTH
jgi:signal transduction histidine kinase/CheY-like chemotaxis protein